MVQQTVAVSVGQPCSQRTIFFAPSGPLRSTNNPLLIELNRLTTLTPWEVYGV